MKNVDAGAAKDLMAYLVKLQSSLDEINTYVYIANFKTIQPVHEIMLLFDSSTWGNPIPCSSCVVFNLHQYASGSSAYSIEALYAVLIINWS